MKAAAKGLGRVRTPCQNKQVFFCNLPPGTDLWPDSKISGLEDIEVAHHPGADLMPATTKLSVAIIGAGSAGIAPGRELLRQGFTAFTILDTLGAPGGTWRLHEESGPHEH